jgi:hypothetical protein
MKNNAYVKALLLLAIFVAGTIYGVLIVRYEVFPYELIRTAYRGIHFQGHAYGRWSIGIFEGSTPFNLRDPEGISNPVLSARDVTDIDAVFVADPFMITNGREHFMFFEVMNRETNQGDIGYAESTDLQKWNYGRIVIDEKFHLSYPYVFEWNDGYYLVPESNNDFSVRLYKAIDFPERWEYLGNLLSGYHCVDNTLFHYSGKWWMFVATGENNVLNLYYSDDLLHGWKPHPLNPIVKFDKHLSRPAGRVFSYENKLYRLAQDDDPSYGIQVFAFEIVELSETTYSERLVSEKPLVTGSGTGWNAAGMHNVDLHKMDDQWVAAVDGRSR